MKAVSACLCGVRCRYDGNSCIDKELINDEYFLICPELLGGLSTPRNPVEIIGEIKTNTYDDLISGQIKIKDKDGKDYSQAFIDGANSALNLIKENNINEVILKSNSPSCGIGKIYDGNFRGILIDGDGVLAALLKKEKIRIISK